jgi:hypothetical protein
MTERDPSRRDDESDFPEPNGDDSPVPTDDPERRPPVKEPPKKERPKRV